MVDMLTVDASQLVAKLHLAGLQASGKREGDFIVNTGIKNDSPNASPDNPGKVEFDLTGKKYQVGYVTDVSYYKAFGLDDAMNSFEELRSKLKGDNSSIFDKTSKEYEDYENAAQILLDVISSHEAGSVFKKVDDIQTDDDVKKLKDAVKDAAKTDNDQYDRIMQGEKDVIAGILNNYMAAFVGKDNVTTKVTADNLATMTLSPIIKDANSKGLVNNFEIQPISDSEKDKLIAQFRANFQKALETQKIDPKFQNCNEKICFYVAYDLDVDK